LLYKYCFFRSKHTVAVVAHAHVLQNFYTTWVRGVACQKQRLGPKLERVGLGEHPQNLGPLRISATVEASNFKIGTQLGFGTSLPKNNVFDQNWRGLSQKSIQKIIWDPLCIFATVEASNFKFGTQIGFGLAYQKRRLRPKLAGVWARGTSEEIWDPLFISATVEASD